jgi:DNA-binding beta-propeller fold protein YncE
MILRSYARRVTHGLVFVLPFLACLTGSRPAHAASDFTLFESGHVRPLALSPNGELLFAVNTPANRLEVFHIKNSGLSHSTSIPVGLEPVAVAARKNNEVWVVNHLSDSVSIVKLSADADEGRVVQTLLVGDEPRDIVFGGQNRKRAFITTAHRGQNIPFDPQLTTPGIGRADVWVFDGKNPGDSLTGDPLTILTLFTDTPRALAVTPDGSTVYAAGFHSGNQTTVINDFFVPDGGEANDGVPDPPTNFEGVAGPEVGLVVKYDGAHWVDELGRAWDDFVKFSLPDKDVFAIDANANPPAQVAGPSGFYTGVGTILYNMIVNPVNGKVYVANTEAFNEVRFEGPAIFGDTTVRGHLHESRITVLSPGAVTPRHLNKHIDYSSCCAPVPNAESEKSLAFPQGMAITKNGTTLYVAALGSSKIGVFNTTALENDTFTPNTANQIEVSGGGPTGLVLDEGRNRLYALTRFDNSISIINTTTKQEIQHHALFNPEPESVVVGRKVFYDARTGSSHGDSSCASCHVFGDFDSLAWDLGNPDAEVIPNPGPFMGIDVLPKVFHPLKGPMVTQSLRGMQNHGPMHWRGDRTGGNDEPTAQPDSGTFDEDAAFKKFAPAFMSLLGRDSLIPVADMQAFTDFILQVTYPPNPIRNLDNSLTPSQQAGRDHFMLPSTQTQNLLGCVSCHVLDPDANPSSPAPGFFGTSGTSNFDFVNDHIKAPHLRNQYQKLGMFGMAEFFVFSPRFNEHMGDQVRGIGFTHDGTIDTVFRFVNAITFTVADDNPDGFPPEALGDAERRDMEAFMLAFDSNMTPIVGQQTTLTKDNESIVGPRIDLLIARANEGECDLVAKGRKNGEEVGYLYTGAGTFLTNRQGDPVIPDAALRAQANHNMRELTYTCAPPGSGERIAIDRDTDGSLDGDELDACSDPEDPDSTP